MATCLDTITLAMRQAKILPPGDDPEDGEAQDGLTTLQSMFQSWASNAMFGEWDEVYKTAAYTAKENERITTSGSPTIAIPESFVDGSEEYGDGLGERRAPRELSAIQVVDLTGDTTTTYIYDRRNWVEIESLLLTTATPLQEYGKAGIAANLAIELADLFGGEIGPGVVRTANNFKAAVRGRRLAAAPSAPAMYY